MAIPGTTTPHVGSNRICQGQQRGVAHISSGAGVTGGEVTHSVEEVLPTRLKINKLKLILQGYDVEKLNFLISGFRHGFYLGYQGPRESCVVKNSDSTKDNWEVVNTKLKKEMKMGRMAGPFNMPPFEKFRVSPLAVIPKSTPCMVTTTPGLIREICIIFFCIICLPCQLPGFSVIGV